MGHLLGYARISTTDQQPHLQVDAPQRLNLDAAHLVNLRHVMELN